PFGGCPLLGLALLDVADRLRELLVGEPAVRASLPLRTQPLPFGRRSCSGDVELLAGPLRGGHLARSALARLDRLKSGLVPCEPGGPFPQTQQPPPEPLLLGHPSAGRLSVGLGCVLVLRGRCPRGPADARPGLRWCGGWRRLGGGDAV